MVKEVDNHTLSQATKGDQVACREIIETYKDFAYTVAFRLVNDHHEAEEITQDSFMKALRNLDSFQRQARFSTWLYRITYNTALSRLRKKKLPRRSLDELEDYQVPPDTVANAFEQIHDDQQRKYLLLALEKLKPEEKTLLTLYYLQEMSMEEVAKSTGLKANNAKVKIHRARKKLYQQLTHLLKKETKELL